MDKIRKITPSTCLFLARVAIAPPRFASLLSPPLKGRAGLRCANSKAPANPLIKVPKQGKGSKMFVRLSMSLPRLLLRLILLPTKSHFAPRRGKRLLGDNGRGSCHPAPPKPPPPRQTSSFDGSPNLSWGGRALLGTTRKAIPPEVTQITQSSSVILPLYWTR